MSAELDIDDTFSLTHPSRHALPALVIPKERRTILFLILGTFSAIDMNGTITTCVVRVGVSPSTGQISCCFGQVPT
jgi:hypothetical protein